VLDAFGVSGEPQALHEGQGTTLRVAGVVLKRVSDAGSRGQGMRNVAEEEWRAELYERIAPDGFRVPQPVRALDGRVVVDGWVAFEFLEGEHSLERWDDVLATCDRFHGALRDESRPTFLDDVTDPWTTTQRVVWGETSLEPYLGMKHVARLAEALRPVDAPAQLVHSDFTANVLFAKGLPPAVLDFSPWWAPPEYARAIVVGDALLWYGGEPSLVERVHPQLFLRAVLFRKIVDRLFRPDQPERADEDDHYLPVVELALSVV
jgi:uncharacterized protein (TIGR02569 family)